jgi:thiosulfate/3-mercaptopyruvate sulfurtransferase
MSPTSPAFHTTLIAVPDLAAHLNDAGWVVCDCRHDLTQYEFGRNAYAQSHIPGARFMHLDEDLSGPKTGINGRHPLPHPVTFTLRLAALGIDNGKQVVAYDNAGGVYASRLWWMLRWAGHEQAAVLDGGLAKWQREGRPLTADLPQVTAAPYPGKAKASMHASLALVEKKLKRAALLDARAPVRWRGEQEPIDPVAGRIPGAKNRFNNDNLSAEGVFKAPELLRAEFEAALAGRSPADVIHYCGSGVAACHNALAMEIAGLDGSRVYIGSWSEWSRDPARPIARSV